MFFHSKFRSKSIFLRSKFKNFAQGTSTQVTAGWIPSREGLLVEEKFGKYFGYSARCEGSFCTTTPKIANNRIEINQIAGKMPSKFEIWALKTRFPNLKSGPENP